MRIQTQTHVSRTGTPLAELSDLPGVYFRGGDDFLTAWAAARHNAIPEPQSSGTIIEISDVAEERGREARESYERLILKSDLP